MASVHYTAGTNMIELNAQWDGLGSVITKAHFHVAPAGENGSCIFILTDFIIGNYIKLNFLRGINDLQQGNL